MSKLLFKSEYLYTTFQPNIWEVNNFSPNIGWVCEPHYPNHLLITDIGLYSCNKVTILKH